MDMVATPNEPQVLRPRSGWQICGANLRFTTLGEDHRGAPQLFVDEAGDEGFEGLFTLAQDKILGGVGPVELEAGRERRDPNLTDRCVGSDNEFGWRFVKHQDEDAVLFLYFKVAGLFGA